MSSPGKARKPAGFEKDVFVNCPFDKKYYALLRPMMFTIIALGYKPRIALETSDSAQNRLHKICALISGSRYSVHDLSRLKAKQTNEFYRMNMPFELGVDYGTRLSGPGVLKKKRFLILEKAQYDYQKALSDLAGVDIKSHNEEPEDIIRAVRNWFVETVGLRDIPSAQVFWYAFADFASAFYDLRKAQGFSKTDLEIMPMPEYIHFIRKWIARNPVKHGRERR